MAARSSVSTVPMPVPLPVSMPMPATGAVTDADAMADALLTASRLLIAVSVRSLAAVEDALTLPQFRMLVVLDTKGRMNLSQLAAELGVQPSTAMRMIDRLVAVGMVVRNSSPTDRRSCLICLTETGQRTVVEATERRREELAQIAEGMPAGQRLHLVEALQAFTEAGGEPPARETASLHAVGW